MACDSLDTDQIVFHWHSRAQTPSHRQLDFSYLKRQIIKVIRAGESIYDRRRVQVHGDRCRSDKRIYLGHGRNPGLRVPIDMKIAHDARSA
jgi:hypothetical protein